MLTKALAAIALAVTVGTAPAVSGGAGGGATGHHHRSVKGYAYEHMESTFRYHKQRHGQFSCLDKLWTRESGWRWNAASASGAYGIPQALPGSKMASAGRDWRTNPRTQIRWGLRYIRGRYGRWVCTAWDHELRDGWY